MQQDQDKSQEEYLSLLWTNTHYRERREIEEYSSLKVMNSDNNSIKESVEFSEPSFRTNLASEPELLLHFRIRVTEYSELELQKKGERDVLCCCVFKMKERSAIYSASGGVFWSEPNRTVATVRSELLQRFVSTAATAQLSAAVG